MADHRECLTGSTANNEVHPPLITSGIKIADVCKPVLFANVVIGEIAMFALWFDVASEHDSMSQPETLESVLNGTDSTEYSSDSNGILWL